MVKSNYPISEDLFRINYRIKKTGKEIFSGFFIKIFKDLFNPFFFDPCAFTASFAKEIQFRTTHFTYFVQFNAFNAW